MIWILCGIALAIAFAMAGRRGGTFEQEMRRRGLTDSDIKEVCRLAQEKR